MIPIKAWYQYQRKAWYQYQPISLKPICQGRFMGSVCGDGNWLPSQLQPPYSFVDCTVNIKQFKVFFYLIFNPFLRLRFLDVETYPERRPVPSLWKIFWSNVRGLAGNLSDLTVVSSQYDILLCSETLVSDLSHATELLVPGFGHPVLSYRAKCLGPEGWRHTFEMVTMHFANPNLSVVVAKCWFLGFVVWDSSLCRNPDLDDRIFYCLLTSMAAVQANDDRASFQFVGDLNGYHPEWLGCTTTNRHGFAALDFVWWRSGGCRPKPCTWWYTWPPDDWCSWPSTGWCCSTHSQGHR